MTVFAILVDQLLGLLDSIFFDLLNHLINVLIVLELIKQIIYALLFLEYQGDKLLQAAWEFEEAFEFLRKLAEIAVFVYLQATHQFLLHHGCVRPYLLQNRTHFL